MAMATCKTLTLTHHFSFPTRPALRISLLPRRFGRQLRRRFASVLAEATSAASLVQVEQPPVQDTVETLLTNPDDVTRLMKMERRASEGQPTGRRWFPYLDQYRCDDDCVLTSRQVLEGVGPAIKEERKKRMRKVVTDRSYSLCLVVEGLHDLGNVSAAFRSADAFGVQSVHVVSCDASKRCCAASTEVKFIDIGLSDVDAYKMFVKVPDKGECFNSQCRYRENRHVSMGAEKWLDIELWNSTQECFKVLKSRGYQIATTHVGIDAVSIYDMDWSQHTAIVVGNENKGISEEALELSDLHCSIPMKGMVDSVNVSVAAGIILQHAVRDRATRLGSHGDLTAEERQILLAEFTLRHSKTSITIAREYAKREDAIMRLKF